jgi:hypothetical protein
MSGVRAMAFTKTRACPSSVDISSRGLPRGKSDQIDRHIAGCEFCAAEQSFLSAHTLTAEEYEFAEMPAHLRRLAESLLVGELNVSYKRLNHGKGPFPTRIGFRI